MVTFILTPTSAIWAGLRSNSIGEKPKEYYEAFHKDDYEPDRSALPKVANEPLFVEGERVICPTVARSDSTSGYPGMAKAKKRRVSISYQKERHVLG